MRRNIVEDCFPTAPASMIGEAAGPTGSEAVGAAGSDT